MDRGSYVAVVDVGHGNATVCTAGGATAVIDTGLGSSLLEFLAENGITEIDFILISHADQDHIGGLVGLLSAEVVTLKAVYVNPDSIKKSSAWDDLLYVLNQQHRSGGIELKMELTEGTQLVLDGSDIVVDVVAPSKYLLGKGAGSTDRTGRRITSNTMSAVVVLRRGGAAVALLPGDLDTIGLLNLIEARADIRATILVFPHHGGRPGGNIEDFVDRIYDAVQPETVLFSIGRTGHGNPQPRIVERLLERQPDLRIQCTQLSSHCSTTEIDASPDYVSTHFSRGKQTNSCCAGTVVVPLQDGGTLHPPLAAHTAFVAEVAPTALCRRRKSSGKAKKG